jgi:hypothetical protein
MIKSIAKMWYFPSSKDPNKTYETLQYEDGSTSCQCRGWINRVAPDGSRSCTHTRRVDAGQAGVPAVDYTAGKLVQSTVSKKPAVQVKALKVKPAPEPESDKKIPTVRHIQWD